jgi:hypothetical protein
MPSSLSLFQLFPHLYSFYAYVYHLISMSMPVRLYLRLYPSNYREIIFLLQIIHPFLDRDFFLASSGIELGSLDSKMDNLLYSLQILTTWGVFTKPNRKVYGPLFRRSPFPHVKPRNEKQCQNLLY